MCKKLFSGTGLLVMALLGLLLFTASIAADGYELNRQLVAENGALLADSADVLAETHVAVTKIPVVEAMVGDTGSLFVVVDGTYVYEVPDACEVPEPAPPVTFMSPESEAFEPGTTAWVDTSRRDP